MSEDTAATSCCASCGVERSDEIKLMDCSACNLVRYCGAKCQRKHWPQHKPACKKRAAELRDEILFKQPDSSHLGDCPICMIPLPLDLECSSIMTCCSKTVCDGCVRTIELRDGGDVCPFCRTPVPTKKKANRNLMKRIEANDPVAIRQKGSEYFGQGNYSAAVELFKKAAKLGDGEANYQLAGCYGLGLGVERKPKMEIFYWEEAAIGGHPKARYNIGVTEKRNGRFDRAQRHWIIAASQGHTNAVKALVENHKRGLVKKEVADDALRAYKAAVDATKSPQREAAEAVNQNVNSYR